MPSNYLIDVFCQIVDDVFALARAGVMSYTRALNILSFMEFEDAYAPWIAAVTGFNWVLRRLAHNDQELARLQVKDQPTIFSKKQL